jgi:hypothetical protein
MPITHKKKFGIYHWDTFDNRTLCIDQADTLKSAEDKVVKKYGDRITSQGADRVDIVDKKGKVLRSYTVC